MTTQCLHCGDAHRCTGYGCKHCSSECRKRAIPDRKKVGARAEEVRTWCNDHPGWTLAELEDFYRSKGWLE